MGYMETFAIGDIVVLKSGGPTMTVKSKSFVDPTNMNQNTFVCTWFDTNSFSRETHDAVFPELTLKIAVAK